MSCLRGKICCSFATAQLSWSPRCDRARVAEPLVATHAATPCRWRGAPQLGAVSEVVVDAVPLSVLWASTACGPSVVLNPPMASALEGNPSGSMFAARDADGFLRAARRSRAEELVAVGA
jgi:hypothetical protein